MKVVYIDKDTGQVEAVYTNCDTTKPPANTERREFLNSQAVDRDMKWNPTSSKFEPSINPVQPVPTVDPAKAEYAALATDQDRINYLATRLGLV